MAKEIKVSIEGRITEYNLKLFSDRLALQLINKLGTENSRYLLGLLKNTEAKKA